MDNEKNYGENPPAGSIVSGNFQETTPNPNRDLTYGEKAVGITFNPGGNTEVNNIKRLCALVIDELYDQREIAKLENNGEKIAQFTLAIRDIQSGQMWGVKAATWPY